MTRLDQVLAGAKGTGAHRGYRTGEAVDFATEGSMKGKVLIKLPWRVESDSPPRFGPDGFTVRTVIYDACHNRVLRLCPAGTRGATARQVQAAAMAIVAFAGGAAMASDALRVARAPRRTAEAGAAAGGPRP
jgi:hypothetical protein